MDVLLTHVETSRPFDDENDGPYRALSACATIDRIGAHRLVDDPDRADLIVFAVTESIVGSMAGPLRRHPYVRRYREKAFVYNTADAPIPFLPGVYPSIERRDFHPERTRSGHYVVSRVPPSVSRPHTARDLLYSFVGSVRNAPVRAEIMKLRDSAAYQEDVAPAMGRIRRTKDELARQRSLSAYAEVLARSKFALCPRGFGASTMRLFESMRAGCVPVIVSDQWTAPAGPDWPSFSVRVPESSVGHIPELLRRLESQSGDLGAAARQAWEEWFAEDVSFHRIVESCLDISRTRRVREALHPGRARAYLAPLRREQLTRLTRHVAYMTRDAIFGRRRGPPPSPNGRGRTVPTAPDR